MAMEEFNKKKNELETQKAEAEASFDGEKVGELEKAIVDLESTKASYEDKAEVAEQGASESQANQITNLGGSEEELNKRLEGNKEEVKKVEKEVEEKTLDGDIEHKVNEGLELKANTQETKKENIFDKIIAKQKQEQAKQEEWANSLLKNYKTPEEVLLANPDKSDVANYLLEKKMISPEQMVTFINKNPQISDAKIAVGRFLKNMDPDSVKEIQNSKDTETKNLFYKSIGRELSTLNNMQGPDKRHNLSAITNFLKLDQGRLNFEDLANVDKERNPMAKAKKALQEWVELTKQNPNLKINAVRDSSPEDFKVLARIKGLGLEKQDIVNDLKDVISKNAPGSYERALAFHAAGVLSREELDALIH